MNESPVGELPSIEVDLVDEFPGGRHNDDLGLLDLLEPICRDTVGHQGLEDREQEGSLREGAREGG